VEFLLLSGQLDQAFDIAGANGEMETFADFVGVETQGGAETERIAEYYEKRGGLEKAAEMWSRAGQIGRAINLLLKVRALISPIACLCALTHASAIASWTQWGTQ
jgi:hypothetical protein